MTQSEQNDNTQSRHPDEATTSEPTAFEAGMKKWQSRFQRYARYVIAEVQAITIATFQHARHWSRIAWLSCEHRILGWRIHRQKQILGKRMYECGIGDEPLRNQVQETDQKLDAAKAAKKSTRHLMRSRNGQLIQLAEHVPNSSDSHIRTELDQLHFLKATLERIEQEREHEKNSSSMDDSDWTRMGVGYGALMVICVVIVPLLTVGSSSRSVAETQSPKGTANNFTEKSSSGEEALATNERNREEVRPKTAAAPKPNSIVNKEPSKPLRDLVPIGSDDDLPGTGIFGMADDAFVELVTKPTSYKYLEAGFKEFRFGASSATVQSLADDNKVPLREGRQNFFIEGGKLIGYERLYKDDNEGYLRQFREIFGGALKDNISEALATRRGSTMDIIRANSIATAGREEGLLVRYYFPDSIAYLRATRRASAQANINSVYRREYLLFNIFDHSWVDARLSEHVSDCRDALEWVRQIVADENVGLLTLNNVLDYARAKQVYEAPDDDASVETLKLLDEEDEVFVVVERALKDLYNRPKDSVSIGVHLGAMPAKTNPIYKYMFLAIEIDRCNSLVAQEVFPPRGTTIETLKRRDSHQKSFIWQTSDGWKVTVSPGSHIYLTNIPEKGL